MTSTETPAETPAAAPDAVVLYPDSTSLPAGPARRNPLSTTKLTLVIADLLMVTVALVVGTWVH